MFQSKSFKRSNVCTSLYLHDRSRFAAICISWIEGGTVWYIVFKQMDKANQKQRIETKICIQQIP